MEQPKDFRFAIQKPPPGPLVEVSAAEMENTLLKRLEAEKAHPANALWELARFYQQSKQPEKGLACLRQVLAQMPDAEQKASCVLAMGQMMESARDYQAAVQYYKEALALEPVQTDVWYFINNNLGFSLNTLGQFAEGEKYCRKALEVNPNRQNAYKNLGIALAGQEDYAGAAQCFVAATQVNAADPRSFELLRDLARDHPELEYEFQDSVEACQKAIEAVGKKMQGMNPVVLRGWRKHLFLWRTKLQAFVQQFRKPSRKTPV
jgi:tetratricopeptide (TPR) repeat protein